MTSTDWNLTAYLVSLSQSCETENKCSKRESCHVQREEADSERVFTELKPAFEANVPCCSNGQKDGKRVFQCLNMVGPDYGREKPEFYSVKGDEKFDLANESVVEQPLISWDLNRLAIVGSETIVGDVCDEAGNHDVNEVVGSGCLRGKLNSNGLGTNCSKGQSKEDRVTDEEFKFPKCIEDQFREMILRAYQQNNWHCDKCGNKIVQDGTNDTQPPLYHQLHHKQSFIEDHVTSNCWGGNDLDVIAEGSLKHSKIEKDAEETREEQEDWATETCDGGATKCFSEDIPRKNQELANDIQDESIEQLLEFINPEVDVMGKTFHNIPSTQPIYSDNEGRDGGSGDEARVRRPMNAFMLWARKYRSLVAKEFSEASNSEISVKLGEIWNELTSDQQKPYFKKAEWLKAKHKQTHPNYVYQPRQSYKTVRKIRNPNFCTGTEIQGGFGMLPLEFSTAYGFLPEMKQKVAMPVAPQEQSKDHVKPIQSPPNNFVEVQHKIMAPKPVYPKGVATRREKCSDVTKSGIEEHSSMTEHHATAVYIRNDTGLVKDAMMPRLERNGEEHDFMNNQYPLLNVENLDEFLAEENHELITYLENYIKRKDFGSNFINLPKKSERTKRSANTKVKGQRAKKVKRSEKN